MGRTGRSALRAAGVAAALGAIATGAWASPVTYIGYTLANGKIGDWSFTNAEVTITFNGDTSTVQEVDASVLGATLSFQPTGTASVKIAKGDKVVQANFVPDLIFVSVDQDNGGVGFGYFDGSGTTTAHVVSPTYPLGICCGAGSADLTMNFYGVNWLSLSYELYWDGVGSSGYNDLTVNAAYSGRAYICPTFPQIDCFTPPTVGLPTDHGDLYLYAPYVAVTGSTRPQNAGFFTAVVSP